jgi:Protein-glutamine gamma-glutamyltransferase
MTSFQKTPLRNVTFLISLLILFGNPLFAAAMPAQIEHTAGDEGIRFSCKPEKLVVIESGMEKYLAALKVESGLVVKKNDQVNGIIVYTLTTPIDDTNTLDLKDRPEFDIHDEFLNLPSRHGKVNRIGTVSRKEILLALLQHGRLTEFKGDSCDVQALKDHIGIRQNIVAWGENLNWVWPDGEEARWNKKYWLRGTPKPGHPLHEAIGDVFLNQDEYAIGCYTSAKLVMIQGLLDYYHRIRKDPVQLMELESRLTKDQEPLSNIEPGKMWDFEKDFDPQERHRPGKLLKIEYRVASNNFIPGDWVHFYNNDPSSYQKTGYEGSNPIYLGQNKFSDYFNDHDHSYTYRQKLDEVYQWRNGVFSRSRDAAKSKPLTPEDIERLSHPPIQGGILTDMRVFPYFFGYEELPEMRTVSK